MKVSFLPPKCGMNPAQSQERLHLIFGLKSSQRPIDEMMSGSWCDAKTCVIFSGSNSRATALMTAGKTCEVPPDQQDALIAVGHEVLVRVD